MGRLDEKIAIVTGANSGMGMATAKALAKAGRIHFDDINLKHGYNVVKAYSQSKPANSSKRSTDTELARKLFELSENIVSK